MKIDILSIEMKTDIFSISISIDMPRTDWRTERCKYL